MNFELKRNDYKCPKCHGHLNVGDNLIFATETQRKHKGIIILHPEIGKYSYKHHEDYYLSKGEKVEFKCPLCQADLTSKNPDYAMINMVSKEDNAHYEIYFSKIAGNKSTYVVADDRYESYGEDAGDFEDIFF